MTQRVIPSLKFIRKRKRWLMTTIFLSITCYNVTMLTNNYYNDFFELGQQKINFSFFELSLPDDDPVYTLKKVMEELDFSGLLANCSDKGKNRVQPNHDVCCSYLCKYAGNTFC